MVPLAANPDLQARHEKWASSRAGFNEDKQRKASDWQKDYFQGKTMDGEKVDGHMTRLKLGAFTQAPPTTKNEMSDN
jgi:hypothetical protein